MIISKFQLDRNKNINSLLKDLKFFISKSVSTRRIKWYLKKLSKIFDIPQSTLNKETKIVLYNNFENLNGKINKKFLLRNLFFYSIKFIALSIFILVFSKKIKKIYKCDMIVDNIDKSNSPIRFFELKKYFKIIFVSSDFKTKKKNFYNFAKYKNCSKVVNFIKNPIKLVIIFFITLYASIRSANNLFPIAIEFIKTISRSETIFQKIKSNFIIQERHYNTSELKNYIFKKKGGKYSCVTQKNILQINGVGMYVYTDIFFSLGTQTAKYLSKYGGQAKKIIPIGSLAMELNYFKRKEKNTLKSYDLLVFASDHNKSFHSGYNNYYREYMKHYEWLEKFSIDHPNYSIGIKLKKVITDKNVINKFKNIKNVKFLFDSKYLSDSYYFASKAKSICTWSSTLAFEFLGQGRIVYFCDPKYKNTSYLPNDFYIKKFKLNTYKIFEKKILNQIKKSKERILTNKKLRNSFCLPSNDVSKNIYQAIKKIN